MMVGKVFAERYELIEKIAEGGMAHVYKGRDLVLKRTIAVKVLKDQMTGDAAFIRRFEREAQSAGALSHPYIVNIYDVGEQDGIHYIVMEYVDGKNLKDYIREKGRIPVHEAAKIIGQVAEALQQAHAAGVVHRDIKPQNILFSRDGKVKVTDFGIALAGDGMTVTFGNDIIGSVQYISPEQARGTQAGKQSDLYSLGIVFYEMVTGKVPFSGESPVAVAMKHIQEQIVPPRRLVSDIPDAFDQIILKAVQKDAAERYTNTGEFLEDLYFAQEKKASRMVPVRGAGNNGVDEYDEYNDEILKPLKENSSKKGGFLRSKGFRFMLTFFFVLAFLALLAGGGVYFYNNYIYVPEVAVPDVQGMSQTEAVRLLENEGLTAGSDVSQVYDDDIAPGNVVNTDPPAGRLVRENRVVDLFISKGTEYIVIPDLSDRTEMEAQVILDDLDLRGRVIREYNEDVEKGKIFRQVPGEGFRISPGEEVDIYVSEGAGPFEMADLVGYSEQGAIDYLESKDLKPRIRYKFAIGASGHVVEQKPEAGEEVRPGQSVDLVVGQ